MQFHMEESPLQIKKPFKSVTKISLHFLNILQMFFQQTTLPKRTRMKAESLLA